MLNYLLILLGFFSTNLIMFDNSNIKSGLNAILLGFWVWANIPYLILLLSNKYLTKTKVAKTIVSATAGISVLGAALIYYEGFYVNPGAQSGLVFIFLPIYQNALIVIFSILAAVCQLNSKQSEVSVKSNSIV